MLTPILVTDHWARLRGPHCPTPTPVGPCSSLPGSPGGSALKLPGILVLQASHCLWPGHPTCASVYLEQAKRVGLGRGWWEGLPGT